jgi:hypothetical protein
LSNILAIKSREEYVMHMGDTRDAVALHEHVRGIGGIPPSILNFGTVYR